MGGVNGVDIRRERIQVFRRKRKRKRNTGTQNECTGMGEEEGETKERSERSVVIVSFVEHQKGL